MLIHHLHPIGTEQDFLLKVNELKQQLINIDNMNNDDESEMVSDIRSLNALRKELDYMYPAIKAIYDELESTRDTS